MIRSASVHYINPYLFGITPNVNASTNDLFVYTTNKTTIKVYCPKLGLDFVDGAYPEWKLTGRNRRLAQSEGVYTIYARLSKTNRDDAYIVFAPMVVAQVAENKYEWYDKYSYLTRTGLSVCGAQQTVVDDPNYWYVRLGEVSEPIDGQRVVELDTGILGTAEWNNDWALNPDALPLRIDMVYKIGPRFTPEEEEPERWDAGSPLYVRWDQVLDIHAQLVEGWTGTDITRFHHWEITRNTGSDADAEWNAAHDGQGEEEYNSTDFDLTLVHTRGQGDDFNGKLSTIFTFTAYEKNPDYISGSELPQYIPLISSTFSVMAEPVESYELEVSSETVTYNPQTGEYVPAIKYDEQTHKYSVNSGVTVRVRAKDADGNIFYPTDEQLNAVGLKVYYQPIDSTGAPILLTLVNGSGTLPSAPFIAGKGVNTWLQVGEWQSEEEGDNIILTNRTVTYIRFGLNGDTPVSCYRWYKEGLTPLKPTDTSKVSPDAASGDETGVDKVEPRDHWSATAPDRPETGEWALWMCSSIKHGDGTIDAWSSPIRISGIKGDAGEDATDREYIYRRTNTYPYDGTPPADVTTGEVSPNGIANGTETDKSLDDWVPNNWSDTAISADSANKYVYISIRTKEPGQQWGKFSAPVLWSNWGEKGMDGDGVQYIFKLFADKLTDAELSSNIPTRPSSQNANGEWLPIAGDSAWTDDPQDPTEALRYCYCSTIKRVNGTWGNYEKLALWSYWSKDGKNVTKESETYYYIKNTTGTRPPADDSNWSTDKPTIGQGEWLFTKIDIKWSDNSHTYLFTDERNPNDGKAGQDIIVDGATVMKYYVSENNAQPPADDSSDWKNYSDITLVKGKWLWAQAKTNYKRAKDGSSAGSSYNYNVSYIGTDGENGKDGKDGRSVVSITEYYKASNLDGSDAQHSETAPEDGQETEKGWSTDPNLGDLSAAKRWNEANKYLWNYEKVEYSSAPKFVRTSPAVLAIWTKDGAAGAAGRGIDSIVNYYKVTDSNEAPSRPQTDGADGWTQTPQAPGQGQYLWNYEKITWLNPKDTTYTDVQQIGYAGTDGKDADVWTIDEDGWWCKNGVRQNVKAEGKDGTGVEIKGGVDVLFNNDKTSQLQTSLEGLEMTQANIGECYTVTANKHLYFYDNENPASSGVNPFGWRDLGKFRGDDGQSSYMHIAYADDVTLDEQGHATSCTGFTTVKQKEAYAWMGLCTNNSQTDPADFRAYEWNKVKGADGTSVRAQYSADGTNWHDTFQSGDKWMRNSSDSGATWTSAIKIVGENGSETDYSFGISAQKTTASATTAPTLKPNTSWSDSPVQTETEYPYLWSRVQKKDGSGNNVGSASYIRLNGEDGTDGKDAQYVYLKGTARDVNGGITDDLPCEVRVGGGENLVTSIRRGLNLVTLNRQTLAKVEEVNYDTYGEAVDSPNRFNDGITNLIAKLNEIKTPGESSPYYEQDVFVCLVSRDAVGWQRPADVTEGIYPLITALQGYGMSDLPYTAAGRYPFLFIGYKNLGKGNGLTRMRNLGAYTDVAELSVYVANGALTIKDGKDGKDGRSIVSITEYYKASSKASGEIAPSDDSGWSTDPNTAMRNWNEANKYLWNYEKVTYSSGVTVERTTPQILAIWTKDGAAGKGIDSITNYYKITPSATAPLKPATPGTEGWKTTPQAPGQGEYLWNYEIIKWVNGTPATTETAVQMIGYAGTDGTSPVFADIDNEMDSVACNKDGFVVSEQDVETHVSMFRGNTLMTGLSITSIVREDTEEIFTAEEYGGNTWAECRDMSSLKIKVSYENNRATIIFRFLNDEGESVNKVEHFTINASAGGESKQLTFTVNGVRPGADGTNAVLYSLNPSASEIVKKKNGGTEPNSNITCSVIKTDGDSRTAVTTGFVLKTYVDGTEQTSSTVSPANVNTGIVYELYVPNASGVLVDKETIPVVTDGADGVVYKIDFTDPTFALDPNTGKNVVSIKGAVYKDNVKITNITAADFAMRFVKPDGSTVRELDKDTEFGIQEGQFVTSFGNGDKTLDGYKTFVVDYKPDGTVLTQNSLALTVYGEKGMDAIRGYADYLYSQDDTGSKPGPGIDELGKIDLLRYSGNQNRVEICEGSGSSYIWKGYGASDYPDGTMFICRLDNHLYRATANGWQDEGRFKGDNAVVYKIDFTDSTFAYNPVNRRYTVNVQGIVYKSDGGNTTIFASLGTGSSLELYFLQSDGQSEAVPSGEISISNGAFSTDYHNDDPNTTVLKTLLAIVKIGTGSNAKEVARANIPVATIGTRGKRNRSFYYAQPWRETSTKYLVNDAQAPYFLYNGNYYVFNPDEDVNDYFTMAEMGQPSTDNPEWQLMDNTFKYIITEAIFGSFAHFGSFIINDTWLFSQKGRWKDDEEFDSGTPISYYRLPYTEGDQSVSASPFTLINEEEPGVSKVYLFQEKSDLTGSSGETYLTTKKVTIKAGTVCCLYAYDVQTTAFFLRKWDETESDVYTDTQILPLAKDQQSRLIECLFLIEEDGKYDIVAAPSSTGYLMKYSNVGMFEAYFSPNVIIDGVTGKAAMNNVFVSGTVEGNARLEQLISQNSYLHGETQIQNLQINAGGSLNIPERFGNNKVQILNDNGEAIKSGYIVLEEKSSGEYYFKFVQQLP